MLKASFMFAVFAAVFFSTAAAQESEFSFKSSYDGSSQQAVSYIPDGIDNGKKYPLIVVAHYMNGNRFTAKALGYYDECEKRKWLLVCPELHGKRQPGKTSFASLEAQHDVIDAVDYMRKNYPVDNARIYIAGRSMGGMLTQIMMAKYPDLFAAGVSGQGVSDLLTLRSIPVVMNAVREECGDPVKDSFEYRRRSSVNYASNLAYAPLMLWHGTNDSLVQAEQSEALFEEIRKHNRFQEQVYWLNGSSHMSANYSSAWICDKLQYYTNASDLFKFRTFNRLRLVTDEDKKFFWLELFLEDKNDFGRIDAGIDDNGLLSISCENLSKVRVDLDMLDKTRNVKSCKVKSVKELSLEIIRGGNVLFVEKGNDFEAECKK